MNLRAELYFAEEAKKTAFLVAEYLFFIHSKSVNTQKTYKYALSKWAACMPQSIEDVTLEMLQNYTELGNKEKPALVLAGF